jgi:hypothetical protein
VRGSVSRARRFNHKLTVGASMAGLVPVGMRRPLVARQARGLLPFLRTLRTDTRGIECVPSAMTAGVAIPAIVFLWFPAAARAADALVVGVKELFLQPGGAAMDQEGQAGQRQQNFDHSAFQYRVIRRPDHVFCFGHGGCVNSPPSTNSVWPVTNALSSLARNRTARATSPGSPTRPSGVTAPHVPA